MVVETVQKLAILILSIIYPAYKSVRVIRKQETPTLKLRLIKYWVIFFILQILQRYFQFVLDSLEMQDYFFLVLFVALIFQEFKYAEFAYHFCFETAFKRNEEMISNARRSFMQMWRDNCSKWVLYLKKNVVGLLSMLARLLPAPLQAFTLPFFEGLMSSYGDAYQQSKAMESTTEFSDAPSAAE
mmetsp:Transcript_11479/g.15487  ORF Transcript_11479/g.15487 Transcript_11479/m.15487 type:complete len:185 (-) Transcript_11479:60-614(-)|eukprot:CAMPEP_0185579874 /NCGR_PEP_ID=MMETSP0434-20130131/15464_1 /TAXON_ID=626734 ORGANISM="Favella taraikaensis, Strain Fe Narragansett Bay" /NCGR_SAMPLE_ID=MMETSP0434 /ASSEMBLY_ACC=CAM_ASM_000379 /LENGTH=184 /DNA_ID=CAMNT_0028197981 /DNA_START=6 /DNA_END=560 /DNA_ORIENTATION=-